ncbi:MAG: ComEC/Rec2 family competence protein [Bacteroidales bacterium]|jgi:competence protein ComEC
MFWSRRPAIRILIWYIPGILAWKYLGQPGGWPTHLNVLFSVMALLFYLMTVLGPLRHAYRWMTGVALGLLFLSLGWLLTSFHSTRNEAALEAENKVFLARLISDPSIGKNVISAELEIWDSLNDLKNNTKPIHIQGYFEKCKQSEAFRYGQLLLVNGSLIPVAGPSNPEEFDYRNFLSMKNIHYTMYLKSENWDSLGIDPPNKWMALAYQSRWKLLSVVKSSGLNNEEFAVASAILLGNDDFMEAGLRQNFVYAGAMHILCVSGLHVGIIFIIFNFLFSFLNKNKYLKYLKAFLLILLIWTYASITGLSPSVQRAGLMVSFFIFSQLTSQHKDNINTLAFSALILLLINPMLLFHIGFQLSYAAVAGILLMYQPIYRMMYFKNSIADGIWSITALSLAAQIATFPMAVHYFHFFPSWFWLTNLFTYPLSFAILTGGMAFMMFSWVPYLSVALGWLLSGMIYLLNYLVDMVKYLPYPGINNLYLPSYEVILVYLLIVLLAIFIFEKKWKLVLPILMISSILFGIETMHHLNHLKQQGFVVYHIRKQSLIQFVEGSQNRVIADSTLLNDLSLVNFSIQSSQAKWGQTPYTGNSNLTGYYHDGAYILFNNQRIMLINEHSDFIPTNQKLSMDMLVVSGKPAIKPDDLVKTIQTNLIITDGSVPAYWKKKLALVAKQNQIRHFDTSKDGAFTFGID